MITLVGGPADGRVYELQGDAAQVNELRFPVMQSFEAIWTEETEEIKGYIDAWGDWRFGSPPEFQTALYRRAEGDRFVFVEIIQT